MTHLYNKNKPTTNITIRTTADAFITIYILLNTINTQWQFYVGAGDAITSSFFGFVPPGWHDAIELSL